MKLLQNWGFNPHSWQGQRGEYWVLVQAILILGFACLPTYQPLWLQTLSGSGLVGSGLVGSGKYLWWGMAVLLGGAGLGLFAKGLTDLGHSLTPLPYPRDDGQLVQSGVYGLVRHPVYSGVIFVAIAWALYQQSLSHCLGAGVLFVFFAAKANREENWLNQKYPGYADYQERVKKLIPWLY